MWYCHLRAQGTLLPMQSERYGQGRLRLVRALHSAELYIWNVAWSSKTDGEVSPPWKGHARTLSCGRWRMRLERRERLDYLQHFIIGFLFLKQLMLILEYLSNIMKV